MRKINLQKAFGVDRKICSEYKIVLLVDDIYTTGSTFDACAKVLKVAGVEKGVLPFRGSGRMDRIIKRL